MPNRMSLVSIALSRSVGSCRIGHGMAYENPEPGNFAPELFMDYLSRRSDRASP